ncbi:uncharacterized protein [Heliangelus exortis]|uniref:uncharacterized protein isoform X2 n=1 Tax=Heliangelus exortis TaxID=472823 RepID=UPI003A935E4F
MEVLGTRARPVSVVPRCVEGVFSSIRLWRGIAVVLTSAVILILCVLLVNRSSGKDLPVCPSLELCPSDWLYFQRKCYFLSDTEANWNYSHSLCSLHNASLLVIENHQELSFMMKITKQDPWIGLYKRNEEFFWNIFFKRTNLHAPRVIHIAKIFLRLLRDVFILLMARTYKKHCLRERSSGEFKLHELLCGNSPEFCLTSVRFGAICSSHQQLFHLLKDWCWHLPAGVGRITSDSSKH